MTQKTIRILLTLFLCLIIVRAFYYTPSTPTPSSTTLFTGNMMTMDYNIVIGGRLAAADRHKAQMTIDDVFHEINTVYNKWNPDSELSMLNRMHAGEQRILSSELQHLLQITQQIVEMTEKRFDPTIEPLQRIWTSSLSQNKEPSNDTLASIIPAIGWEKIHFHNGIFHKDHDLTSIDLGGIAKGYGVDLLVERLHNAGFSNLFVEWGGEVRALGQHPDKREWQVMISNFQQNDIEAPLGQITLHDNAVATSGDYFQNWQLGEITYFHLIDPRTHRPLIMREHSIASASVCAPSCAIADGLATAAMMFETTEEAESWIKRVQAKETAISFYIFQR